MAMALVEGDAGDGIGQRNECRSSLPDAGTVAHAAIVDADGVGGAHPESLALDGSPVGEHGGCEGRSSSPVAGVLFVAVGYVVAADTPVEFTACARLPVLNCGNAPGSSSALGAGMAPAPGATSGQRMAVSLPPTTE